jgi:hypothetical protein
MDMVNSKNAKFAEVYGEINHTMTTATCLVQEKLENKLSQDVATNRRKAFVLKKRAHDRIRRKERIPRNTHKSSEGVTKSYCIYYFCGKKNQRMVHHQTDQS